MRMASITIITFAHYRENLKALVHTISSKQLTVKPGIIDELLTKFYL